MQLRSLSKNQAWQYKIKNDWFKSQGNALLPKEGVCHGVAAMGTLYTLLDEVQPNSIKHFNEYYYFMDKYKENTKLLIHDIQGARETLANLKLRETAIANAWKRARDQGHVFNKRSQLNDALNEQLDDWIQEEWQSLLNKAIDENKLTRDEVLLTELPALFEGTQLCYEVDEFNYLFDEKNKPVHQNSLSSYTPIMPRSLEKKGGVVEAGLFTGAYFQIEILEYLASLKRAMENGEPAFAHNIGLRLGNLRHAISINYDSRTKQWVFVNANRLPATYLSDYEAANAIMNSFTRNGVAIFSTQVVVRRDHQEVFSKIYSQWQQSPVHKVSKLKAVVSDSKNLTWLTLAAAKGQYQTTKKLISKGANLNNIFDSSTALFFAADNGYLDIVNVLINAGADVNKSEDGETPLYSAAQNGYLGIVKTLIAAGADVNMGDAIYIATQKGHLDIVKALIAAGADVNKTFDTYTPLYNATMFNRLDIAQELITAGAKVNRVNKYQQTPLHIAAENGYLDLLNALIAAGANANKKNQSGKTPLDLAHRSGNVEVIKVLADIQDETKEKIDLVNLAISGNINFKDDHRVKLGDDNYLGWSNSRSSFFNITHGDDGRKRSLVLADEVNRDGASLKKINNAIKEAFYASPAHKHSLSRYLTRYLHKTDAAIHDLTESEFTIRKKNIRFV